MATITMAVNTSKMTIELLYLGYCYRTQTFSTSQKKWFNEEVAMTEIALAEGTLQAPKFWVAEAPMTSQQIWERRQAAEQLEAIRKEQRAGGYFTKLHLTEAALEDMADYFCA